MKRFLARLRRATPTEHRPPDGESPPDAADRQPGDDPCPPGTCAVAPALWFGADDQVARQVAQWLEPGGMALVRRERHMTMDWLRGAADRFSIILVHGTGMVNVAELCRLLRAAMPSLPLVLLQSRWAGAVDAPVDRLVRLPVSEEAFWLALTAASDAAGRRALAVAATGARVAKGAGSGYPEP